MDIASLRHPSSSPASTASRLPTCTNRLGCRSSTSASTTRSARGVRALGRWEAYRGGPDEPRPAARRLALLVRMARARQRLRRAACSASRRSCTRVRRGDAPAGPALPLQGRFRAPARAAAAQGRRVTCSQPRRRSGGGRVRRRRQVTRRRRWSSPTARPAAACWTAKRRWRKDGADAEQAASRVTSTRSKRCARLLSPRTCGRPRVSRLGRSSASRARSTRMHLVEVEQPGPGAARGHCRSRRTPPPPARRLHADRPAHGPARGADRDPLLRALPRARQGLVLEGPAREGRHASRATRSASRWPAARSTRRSPRCTCCARRGDASARSRSSTLDNPMCAGHRPPHLQRLHEGLHLPEAGAGQHPADRNGRPHRRAAAAVGRRDLRPAHALEPAQRPAAVRRCRTTARTSSSSGSARPATRWRTTC